MNRLQMISVKGAAWVTWAVVWAVAVVGGVQLVGCAAVLPVGTKQQREQLAAMTYPADAEQVGTLNIAVAREGRDAIRLINREPRAFERVVLWLNQQYVGIIDRVDIGKGDAIPLNRFVNTHGETFPTGSFLAPDQADALLSAERVNAQGQRERLIVWPDERWQD